MKWYINDKINTHRVGLAWRWTERWHSPPNNNSPANSCTVLANSSRGRSGRFNPNFPFSILVSIRSCLIWKRNIWAQTHWHRGCGCRTAIRINQVKQHLGEQRESRPCLHRSTTVVDMMAVICSILGRRKKMKGPLGFFLFFFYYFFLFFFCSLLYAFSLFLILLLLLLLLLLLPPLLIPYF